jgi:hypothetical protein
VLQDIASADRIGKLVRLLSSPQDHEVLAAARALVRAADVHALADVVERHWHPLPVQDELELEPADKPWQAAAQELLRHAHVLGMRGNRFDQKLYAREFDFLTNMRKSRFAPTAGQEKWLADIAARRKAAA